MYFYVEEIAPVLVTVLYSALIILSRYSRQSLKKIYLYEYTIPEFIFRKHMSHENEAILRKSKSDERK